MKKKDSFYHDKEKEQEYTRNMGNGYNALLWSLVLLVTTWLMINIESQFENIRSIISTFDNSSIAMLLASIWFFSIASGLIRGADSKMFRGKITKAVLIDVYCTVFTVYLFFCYNNNILVNWKSSIFILFFSFYLVFLIFQFFTLVAKCSKQLAMKIKKEKLSFSEHSILLLTTVLATTEVLNFLFEHIF